MASTLSFLTDYVSSSAVRRHWMLVILLFSLLNLDVRSNCAAQAVPVLRMYPMPENGLVSPSVRSSSPFQLLPISNFTPTENPLVSISLPSLRNFSDSTTILKIASQHDSSTSFVIDVSSPVSDNTPPLTQAILYGFIGVTVTNLCSLTGLIFVPLKRFRYYNIVLTVLVSLAVGALSTTAICVLIPEALRMVDMPAEFGGQGRFYLWKMVSIVLGCMFFYCLEYFLFLMPKLCKWNKEDNEMSISDKDYDETTANGGHGHSHGITFPTSDGDGDADIKQSTSLESSDDDDDEVVISSKPGCCAKMHCNVKQFTEIAPVAWMILLGDGFHNMMDGVTIGAGFSQSPILGLTLSLSIMFEELPHELGDFAILISSGLSTRAALCSNLLSACSAYIGLIIGLAIGEVPEGALYVFAVTAGLFIYISVSDMLPTMRQSIEKVEKRNGTSYNVFLLQMLGFFVGFGCVIGVTISSDYINF